MKKIKLAFAFLACWAALSFVACGDDDPTLYKVSFSVDGVIVCYSDEVESGVSITLLSVDWQSTQNPGLSFAGWYDETFTTKYESPHTVTQDLTMYAKFE